MDECNILFSYIIIIIIAVQWSRPHTHTPTHAHTHTLRGTFDSYKWPVLVLWVCCGCHGGRGGGDCNQSADINIFRVANHKLLRLAGGTAATALCPPSSSSSSWLRLRQRRPVGPCAIRQPSMRIEWNHKLIKRDLFAACKGFCHTQSNRKRGNNKENVRCRWCFTVTLCATDCSWCCCLCLCVCARKLKQHFS